MTRALVILTGPVSRQQAANWCVNAPVNTRVEFKESKRSVPQNALMWSLLTEISKQLVWHGVRLTPDDWKLVMLDGLKTEMRIVPNISGSGFVNLGRSSSDLSRAEMSDLVELIYAFGALHGVTFREARVAA